MKVQKHARLSILFAACAAIGLTAPSSHAANPVPAEIPKYDGKPGATDKPVKIYIFSGQSNSLGFGRAEGGELHYSSIVLSADPTIKTARMPVVNSGLLPHHVFVTQDGPEKATTAHVFKGAYLPEADYGKMTPAGTSTLALGDVTADLPSIDGLHTVVVEGYNDFLPELQSGKITLAVHSFLRHSGQAGKDAPPKSHLSVWLEEAKIPPLLLEEFAQRESGKPAAGKQK